MRREIKTDFFKNKNEFNDKFKMEIRLLGNEIELMGELIEDITEKFLEELKEYTIPTVFIPDNSEVDYSEANYIDLFYLPEHVDYPTTKLLEYEEENYLTDDDEVGKNLFNIDIDGNKLKLSFISLIVLTEDNKKESIWEFKNGKIKELFIECVSDLINN